VKNKENLKTFLIQPLVKTNQYLTENIDYKYNIVHQWMKCDHTNEICTPLIGLPQGIKVNSFLYDVL
jgi:hypothetical protein